MAFPLVYSPVPVMAEDLSFPTSVNFGEDSETLALTIEDMNGDSYPDLIVYDNYQGYIYLNNGSGTGWETPITFGGSSVECYSVAIGDINGDNHQDIVTAVFGGYNQIYLNNGSDTAWSSVISFGLNELDYNNAVALADFNDDGDLDIVVGVYDGQSRVYLNNSSGTNWATSYTIGGATDETITIAAGDVNNDSYPDIVTGSLSAVNVVYLNNGGSTPGTDWSDSHTFGLTNETRSIALGDVDKDGDIDIVTGQYESQSAVYINNSSGTNWETSHDYGTDTNSYYSIALDDMDKDGDLDIVAGGLSEAGVVYLNNSSGSNWLTSTTVSTSIFIYRVAVGDIDQDGYMDVALGRMGGRQNAVYINGMTGVSQSSTGKRVGGEITPVNRAAAAVPWLVPALALIFIGTITAVKLRKGN